MRYYIYKPQLSGKPIKAKGGTFMENKSNDLLALLILTLFVVGLVIV